MNSEIAFISLFLDRDNYSRYRNFLPNNLLEPLTARILGHLDMWYKNHTEGDPTYHDLYLLCLVDIPKADLLPVLRNAKGMDVTDSALEALKGFKTNRLYQDLSVAAYDASEGRRGATERLAQIQRTLGELELQETEEESPISDIYNLDRILEVTDRSKGIRWRLQVLQDYLGNLVAGDFGFFVARPETGKTTMLASEATYMLGQLKEIKRPLIWFNNEETEEKVILKLYQAELGWTEQQVRDNKPEAAKLFQEQTEGLLIFVDRAYLQKREVETLCNKYNPRIMILDQIDPIQGFKADREDLKLGEIYKWARALTKQHGMSTIAVCQADASAEGKEWLYMDNVANAKTEKQATADFIVGIGKNHDPSFQRVRYLSIMKNKLTGHHTRHEVLIKPEIGRYENL
jgi:KaiC/GvpD/RAD55 family RecA-like ATPase